MLSCVRQHEAFTKITQGDRFDKPTFQPEALLAKLPKASPKLFALLAQIRDLDQADLRQHKKTFKHAIFTDIKSSYGAKLVLSVMIAAGYKWVQSPQGVRILPSLQRMHESERRGVMVLTTTSIYSHKMDATSARETLKAFNQRPENVYGDDCRFVILDSSFKEGVDLFDVKYFHLLEQPLQRSDLIQAVGRARRYCGQSGLPFGKTGWSLDVYNYVLVDTKGRPILDEKIAR